MSFDNTTRAGYEKYYRIRGERFGWRPAGDGIYTPARSAPVYIHYNEFHFGEGQKQLAAQMKASIGLDNAPCVIIGSGFNWTGQGLIDAGTTAVIGTDISPYILSAKDTDEEQDIRDFCARSGIDPDVHMVLAPPGHPNAQLLDDEWRIRPLDWWLPRGKVVRSTIQVIGEDGSTNQSRGQLKQALGDDVHHIITEELLNSLDDDEALQVCDYMQRAATQNNITPTGGADVWHMLSPMQWNFDNALWLQSGIDINIALDDFSFWKWNAGQARNPELNWKTYDDWRIFLDTNGFSNHKIICTAPVSVSPRNTVARTLFEVI